MEDRSHLPVPVSGLAREKMKLQALTAIGILWCCALVGSAQAPASSTPKKTAKPSAQQAVATANSATPANEGEKKFRQNCSRCHNAPEELFPRITGTVMLHMRVRASLSADDEREILRYLAP